MDFRPVIAPCRVMFTSARCLADLNRAEVASGRRVTMIDRLQRLFALYTAVRHRDRRKYQRTSLFYVCEAVDVLPFCPSVLFSPHTPPSTPVVESPTQHGTATKQEEAECQRLPAVRRRRSGEVPGAELALVATESRGAGA